MVNTLTSTLSGLKVVGTIMEIVVGLVQNMLWIFIFRGQTSARSLKLEQIIHGYLKGTLAGLIGCAIILTTSSTNLVG